MHVNQHVTCITSSNVHVNSCDSSRASPKSLCEEYCQWDLIFAGYMPKNEWDATLADQFFEATQEFEMGMFVVNRSRVRIGRLLSRMAMPVYWNSCFLFVHARVLIDVSRIMLFVMQVQLPAQICIQYMYVCI